MNESLETYDSINLMTVCNLAGNDFGPLFDILFKASTQGCSVGDRRVHSLYVKHHYCASVERV